MAVVGMPHVALGVSDLARSIAFYRDLLGFAMVADLGILDGASARALGVSCEASDGALLERDGFRLELLRSVDAGAASAARPPTLSHLAVMVDDLASTLHSLRDRGVSIVDETRSDHAPGVQSCLVRDPDGLPIVLYQLPAGVASPWGDV